MTDTLDLRGKTALITGGGRGIGAAITQALCNQGVRTAITFHKNEESAQNTVSPFPAEQTLIFKGEAANIQQAKSIVDKTIETFGKLDILVVNAGIARDRVSWKLPEADWDAVIDTNLKGTFAYVSAVAPHMRTAGTGKIITISSINGIRGKAGQGAYSASKGGMIAFTKAMAKELGPKGINVNTIAPGLIETQMTASLPESILHAALEETALNQLGQPKDVANAVLFLSSSLSSHITGQVINVDGGQLI